MISAMPSGYCDSASKRYWHLRREAGALKRLGYDAAERREHISAREHNRCISAAAAAAVATVGTAAYCATPLLGCYAALRSLERGDLAAFLAPAVAYGCGLAAKLVVDDPCPLSRDAGDIAEFALMPPEYRPNCRLVGIVERIWPVHHKERT